MSQDLRKLFFSHLLEIAKKDKNIVLFVGDLGYSFCEEFRKELPGQFINCGIAEQNMVLAAAGLSLTGFKPYCYSGVIFMAMRPYEQIRNVCFNNLNVKFIGTGTSQFLGFSHNLQGTENIGDLFKHLPNIKYWEPKDEIEFNLAMHQENKINRPAFIKI